MKRGVKSFKIDLATEELTKHFNNTLEEINSIIDSEERLLKQNELINGKKRLLPVVYQHADQIDQYSFKFRHRQQQEEPTQTGGFQKSTKIEEIIRKNQVRSDENWRQRQLASKRVAPPPPPPPQSEKSTDFNADEFGYFLKAIEGLKASNLFQEEALSQMNDQQIYEALIEHARTQRTQSFAQASFSTPFQAVDSPRSTGLKRLASIDKYCDQDEDLPIIIRNLHSVKSLKHFFEIRTNNKIDSTNHQIQQVGIVHKSFYFKNVPVASHILTHRLNLFINFRLNNS